MVEEFLIEAQEAGNRNASSCGHPVLVSGKSYFKIVLKKET